MTALAAAVFVSAAAECARGPDLATAASRIRAASFEQSAALSRMAPLHVLWAACGLLAGLSLRDGVSLKGRHSSPTAAWLAKRAIAGAAVAVSAFALGALRVDAGWMHLAAVVHGGGWLVYLRNLPTKL